ncbi:hypothetical protein QWY14_07210 [Planococcus sp. N028]|uniref:Uncharacterized protein n=1 Tax=Planococcus shixiaomingii TaxID=3058393 RepID=A0ABT8N117_9BACL|nr:MULTISPECIES: hypothetical protein [unclassified Planococcus (in: firmicutes)]MDN7241575.1 hypothetical protein [Planococcus sp. N028]WKA53825.1 hypothetical protein QWY21_14285 [Planococcus sp. N022]
MDIQAKRDLLKDKFGNYYIVSNASGDELTVINIAVYYAFNQMLDESLIAKVNNMYPNKVAIGKYLADLAEEHIERLESSEHEGRIYDFKEVQKHYKLHVKPIYDKSLHM